MSTCKSHSLCASKGIYRTDSIAHVLCQLCEGCDLQNSLKTLFDSYQEEIRHAACHVKKRDAIEVFLCIVAGWADLTNVQDVCKQLLDLCKQDHIVRKLLYASLAARSELGTLTTLLDYERPFLRGTGSICQGLNIDSNTSHGDILMELFLITVGKQQHWLDILLDELSSLLKERNFEQVETFLSHPIFQNLWPFLLLHTIETKSDFSSQKFAADHTIETKDCNPTLKALVEKFKWHLSVILWVEENSASYQTSPELCFQTLSALNIINQSCDISELDWKKTHEFLVKNSADGGFVDKWEVTMFDAFCASALAFQFILTHLHSKDMKIDPPRDSECLKKVKVILCQLEPLSVRLRVMENIFSLLFIRYEDFNDDVCSDSEEGEIDTNTSVQCDDGLLANTVYSFLSSSLTSVTNTNKLNPDTELKEKGLSENHGLLSKYLNQSYHQKHGFVCDRFMTRDILKLLQTNLQGLDVDSYFEEESVHMCIGYGIGDNNNIASQFQYLQDKIAIATWKFETLLGANYADQGGPIDIVLEKNCVHPWLLQQCFDDDSASDDESHGIAVPNIGPRRADAEKSSESGSQSNLTSQGQNRNAKWSRRGRRRSSTRLCTKSTKDTIIKRMLSSNESFICQCLSRGNFEAAKKIVQTLGLEDSEIGAEVNFIEVYGSVKLKVDSSLEQNSKVQEPSSIPKTGKSTLQVIQRAASVGVQASLLHKELEKLLSSQHLPRVLDVEHISGDFLQLFGGSSDEQPVVSAAVDIALILSSNIQQAANFLSIASKYTCGLQNIHGIVTSRSRPMGFLPLIQNILQITALEPTSPAELLHRWDVPSFLTRGFKDTLQFWDSMVRLLSQMQTSNNNVLMFAKLLQLASSYMPSKGLDIKQECHYFQNFKSYLRLLKSVKDRCPGTVVDLPLEEEHFKLLQTSPYKLIANMVLEENLLPQGVEVLVLPLGCNVPHILSLELCSSLSSIPPARPYFHFSGGFHQGVHMLNTFDAIGPSRHPARCVEALLLSVLNEMSYQHYLMQKLHDSHDGYLLFSRLNGKRLLSILEATWELHNLNLTLLQAGAETLAFYCNLANLMWIHCVVYLSSMSGLGDICLKSIITGNSMKQLAAMNSLAYQVGTAGTLTLWEVRQLALGVDLIRPLGTKALQQCAVVTDSCDQLALFVIGTGSRLSPKLKVVYSENLEEQLQQSVQEYIKYWVDIQAEEVIVPYLIQQYMESTGQNVHVFLKDHLNELWSDQTFDISDSLPVSYLSDDPTALFVMEYGTKYPLDFPQVIRTNTSGKANINFCHILKYIGCHSPVVSLLLQELLKESLTRINNSELDEEAQEATELITETSSIDSPSLQQNSGLDRLCKGENIQTLSQIFDENILLCALHSIVPHELLWNNIDNLSKEGKWETVVKVLRALPQLQLQNDLMLSVMLDLALFELSVESRGSDQSWLFCEQINCLFLRAKCIFSQSMYWPGEVCIIQLEKLLQVSELKSHTVLFSKAEKLKHSITIYQKVIDQSMGKPWTYWQEIRSASQKNPELVMDEILYHQNAELCMSWMDLHNIATSHPYLIDTEVVVLFLNDPQDRLKVVEQLLQSIPLTKAATICHRALDIVCRLPALQFCMKFLNRYCIDELSLTARSNLSTVSMGIQMVKSVNATVQQECIELVRMPHLIIEQLIMNVQLEAAEKMLNAVQPQILRLSPKSPMAVSALDSLFRQYAEKALEFRISQGSTASQMSENSVLLTSFSSYSGRKESPIPTVVPSKAEWVPNDQTSVCMNCQLSTFTMFNRRHHCRRCGRVVCAQCSPHRTIVQGYGTLKVRTCISCFSKISEADVPLVPDQLTAASVNSNASVCTENVWRLSNSPTSNDTVRGEFSYEHAPSVSLCLSILKLHSKSAACPNFLIDSCETILGYLQPQGGMPNPEVDYSFVIEMCRSLIVAAKVKCAQWGYISDEPNCDQRLSKIDLFGLLVSHGCTAIIPSETTTHGLRRLQTQLIELELYELALEVLTKFSMERIGVWTAWGKGCLKAGRWREAREKFAHCFPISSRINKSAPDSPLLLDILQILENTPHFVDQNILRMAESIPTSNNRLARAPAVAVLNILASLKSISQGKFSQTQGASGSLQPVVYSECCYYLEQYGSHATYLQFLVRHADFKATVDHTLCHSIDPQIFFESVYMTCLRRGQITPLHSAMTAVDSSLSVWTTYLHGICAALERRKLLHTLYEVQQWSKDHVRAAMTCIRFYHLNAKSYSQLAVNINHLMRAQSHLEGALALASVSRKAGTVEGSESMWLQLSPKELDHHMSTVERQKELTKFLSVYEAGGHTLFDAARWFPHAFAEPLAHGLPTLFGSTADRKLLAGLCLFCGKNVEEAYGIAYRIIEGCNLSAYEIYEAVAVGLFQSERVTEIAHLLNCIQSSGVADPSVVCDSVLMACVTDMPRQPNASDVDFLARNISDQNVKIQILIKCGQLKSAYLLAVKYDRVDDIKLILQEAEKLGQTAMQKICLKRLGRS